MRNPLIPVRFSALLAVAALAGLAPPSASQTCAVTAPASHEVHPVWGGETWATYNLEVGAQHRIWTGEDGGRIRTSWDGGVSWQFAATPADFASSVLDIWFEPDGDVGYAAARGGRALKSIDGGLTWTDLNPTPIYDSRGDLATLWGIRSLDDGTLFVTGNWCFRYSTDGGLSWPPITIFDRYPSLPGATPLQASGLRLFRLDTVGTSTDFAGSVGALWETNPSGGWTGPPDNIDHAVLLHTNSNLSMSNGGLLWWISMDEGAVPASPGATIFEPWAVRYAVGSTSAQSSLGFAIGGRGGNLPSKYYITHNSGRSWALEGVADVTMYDVASRTNGDAMIVGYSGTYLLRDGATTTWTTHAMPSTSTLYPTPGFSLGALEGAGVFGTEGLVAVGDFGSQRISDDAGASWSSMSNFYPNEDELELRIFDTAFTPGSPLTGCMVGQFGHVMYTTDGGCNWSLAYSTGGSKLVALDLNDYAQGVAAGPDGQLIYSTTGGSTWSTASYVPGTAYPLGLNASDISYTDVAFAGNNEAWAIGAFSDGTPVVARSGDGGATWARKGAPTTPNLVLDDIAFSDTAGGLLLGHNAALSQFAYQASYSGGLLTWTALSLPSFTGQLELRDVALAAGSLASVRGFAVGGDGTDGVILEWTGSAFVVPAGVPTTTIELTAVDVAPSGDVALMGGLYDNVAADSPDRGFLVRYDATNGWDSPRAFCGKDIFGISLTSNTAGFIAGQTSPTSSSFINGNLASSVLLRYLAN